MSKTPKTTAALLTAAAALRDEVDQLRFGPPVVYVYNPLSYAWESHRLYLEKFARGPRRLLLLGMNPGPFGMAQTGVPFGDVELVSTWMGIQAPVGKPPREHPARPVLGFACGRSEVSGTRLWGAIRRKHPDPSTFFGGAIALNYCPLLFLEASGRNLTPDKLSRSDRAPLESACDAHLLRVVEVLKPEVVLGVGVWAAQRARAVVSSHVRVGSLPHPSPASPQANRGWAKLARRALQEVGIEPFV